MIEVIRCHWIRKETCGVGVSKLTKARCWQLLYHTEILKFAIEAELMFDSFYCFLGSKMVVYSYMCGGLGNVD
jgi:hypothetical protein